MMRFCLVLCLVVGLLAVSMSAVLAGPNAGGTLILHANPSLVFTDGVESWCGMSGLEACSLAVTSVPWENEKRIVFHVLAAFPPGSEPRLKGLSFGVDYDSTRFFLADHGTCADFQIADPRWPRPSTGVGQSWTTARTDLLTEAYWFVGYAYSEQSPDSTVFSVIPHPSQGGVFVDDQEPGLVDSVATYGALGFGTTGSVGCPTSGGPREYVVQEGDSTFVWALHHDAGFLQLDLNGFAEKKRFGTFPVTAVKIIRRLQDESRGASLSVPIWVPVRPDGALLDSLKHLPPATALRDDRLIKFGKARGDLARRLSAEGADVSDFLGWHVSPDSSFAVLRLTSRTLLFPKGSGTALATIPHAVTDPVFSRDGARCAFVQIVEARRKLTLSGDERTPATYRVLAFDRGGHRLADTPELPNGISQIHVNTSSPIATYAIDGDDGREEYAVLEMRTGRVTQLPDFPRGTRYYSEDDSSMIVLGGPYRRVVRLYDTSDPYNPTLLAESTAPSTILTAAVCDDGSIIAIQRMQTDHGLNLVEVLDRSLLPAAQPLVTSFRNTGLDFEGKYLFVGTQSHPIPAWTALVETSEILVFDLAK
jgi:hypothetical protein